MILYQYTVSADFEKGKAVPMGKLQNMYMINPDLFCIFNRPVLRNVPINPASHKRQLSAEVIA